MAAVRRDRYAERAVTLRIAVIADGGMVQRFALNALDAIEGPTEITVFSCTNTHVRKHWVKHGAYYALNLLAIRNRLTRLVPVRSGTKSVSREIEFESSYDGAWQVLPTHVIEALRSFDLVLKFGMGLLRVPPPDLLPVPILSYHHGDPDNFRGRPAGFWEVFQGASVVGQVMQVIGDRLDAGNVAAFAETKLFPWSYRRTLLDAYRVSPLIINAAIRNALSTTYLEKSRDGRNYRLPSNLMVVRFVIRMLAQVVKRIFYGALQEKAWRVSTSARPEGLLATAFPDPDTWMTIPVASGYSFYADPFFSNDPQAILVEGFRSGVGEIVRIDQSGHRSLIREPGHPQSSSRPLWRASGCFASRCLPRTSSLPSRKHLAPGGGVTLGCAAMLLEQILPNCALHSHRVAGDERGSLISLQSGFGIPFEFKRVYLVYGTRPGVERGFHAHKSLEQWVVCVSGSCVFTVDDGNDRREVLLDSPEKGLQIGSGIWREMRDFTPDAVLMVVASTHYELDDYIRSYDEFLSFVRSS